MNPLDKEKELEEWLTQYEHFEQYWRWSSDYEQWMHHVKEEKLPLWMRLTVASNEGNHEHLNHLNDRYPEAFEEWYLLYRVSNAYYMGSLTTVKKAAILMTRCATYLESGYELPDIFTSASAFPEIAMFLWVGDSALKHKYEKLLEKETHINRYRNNYNIFKTIYTENILEQDAQVVQEWFRSCLTNNQVKEEQTIYL